MSLRINSDFNGVTDPDAGAYIAAVEAADGQLLEFAVGKAINDFVVGCKADGIWSAIKACCILAGARTLSGALQPLAGTAPTNVDGLFVQADYDRKTGLKGDGTSKHLNANRAANVDPVLSKHIAVYATAHHTRNTTRADIGDPNGSLDSQLLTTPSSRFFRVNLDAAPDPVTGDTSSLPGLWAAARTSNVTITGRYNGAVQSFGNNTPISVATAESTYVFSRGSNFSDARLAFYSIGESLDLAKLDARVTALINAFGAAIP